MSDVISKLSSSDERDRRTTLGDVEASLDPQDHQFIEEGISIKMNIQVSFLPVVASAQTQGSAATDWEKLLHWKDSPARGLGRGVSLPSSHTVASLGVSLVGEKAVHHS